MKRVTVYMDSLDEREPDLEVIVEASDHATALEIVTKAMPNHVWYRWRDLKTGENGRNQDVFPAHREDWDEDEFGRYYELDGLPLEDHHTGPPTYRNIGERKGKKLHQRKVTS